MSNELLRLTSGMQTDVPGVWPIHCHIGLHLSEGKMAAMVIQPDVIRQFEAPEDWQGVSDPSS